MYNFTDSPFERMMKQRPPGYREPVAAPPADSPCRGCTIWQGMACMGLCRRRIKPSAKEGTDFGQVGPKSTDEERQGTGT